MVLTGEFVPAQDLFADRRGQFLAKEGTDLLADGQLFLGEF
jgi:hypothetical protein